MGPKQASLLRQQLGTMMDRSSPQGIPGDRTELERWNQGLLGRED